MFSDWSSAARAARARSSRTSYFAFLLAADERSVQERVLPVLEANRPLPDASNGFVRITDREEPVPLGSFHETIYLLGAEICHGNPKRFVPVVSIFSGQ